jgi:hypothetical protein
VDFATHNRAGLRDHLFEGFKFGHVEVDLPDGRTVGDEYVYLRACLAEERAGPYPRRRLEDRALLDGKRVIREVDRCLRSVRVMKHRMDNASYNSTDLSLTHHRVAEDDRQSNALLSTCAKTHG